MLQVFAPEEACLPVLSGANELFRKIAVAGIMAASVWQMDPSTASANIGFDGSRLQPCPYESNCVSSNYLEPPNRYVSPLKTQRSQDAAFASAIRDLAQPSSFLPGLSIVETSPKGHYIHMTVPGTAPSSLDDIELVFATSSNDDSDLDDMVVVNLRCHARVTLPPPPFCIKKNCINGNMDQRQRVDQVAQILGMPKADQERMDRSAKWTPIFFNSDRVPGFTTKTNKLGSQ